jgi:hypothetical protein
VIVDVPDFTESTQEKRGQLTAFMLQIQSVNNNQSS